MGTLEMRFRDYEEVGRKAGLRAGLEEGEALGRKIGLEEGEALGRKAGLEEGEALGHKAGLEEGMELGRTEGVAIGSQKSTLKIAKKMLEAGNSIESIVELTELSKEEVLTLQERG